MTPNYRLLFGPLAAAILGIGIVGLALLVPNYSHVHQTVSEIGETGSPARIAFAVMLGCVAVCILVFAWGVRDASVAAHHSPLAAYSIGFMAVSAAGIAVFAYPHPAHNIFGMSELIGYQAPLAFALAWRHDPSVKHLVVFSWIFFLLIWGAIALNLSPFVAPVWVYLKPFHGLVQRALFAAWFGWCAIAGILLFKRS
ncbi:MAG TPA: DUF998 domain-containing protein [Candidatus Udaeobacter sp.]|nr:DUF998 domain-containing protein [Candidatus Udaeobacter sp.]